MWGFLIGLYIAVIIYPFLKSGSRSAPTNPP
ncbi:hypothetical protein SAMN05444169_4089 [Bradyrhizobium erythrophlei]|uniref:Uncharacterized protein n=1 Tax=Bradyrhizobium erythrophlei TaxID=1437360 RepID=A0A1M5ML87_9BRAD|nr:hypothetical protein SAMN05444169_4089 [Bradyrhizobium erythrophlei]